MIKDLFHDTLSLSAVGAVVLVLMGPVAAAEAAPKILPHKALYDVSLTSVHSGSQISDIRGEMFFEWKQTCEAWVTDHRSNLVYQYADGQSVRMTTDFVTYESLDGQSLDFTSKRMKNGQVFSEFRGHAKLNDGHAGDVKYSTPDFLHYQLPEGSYFPMDHTLHILKNAQAGNKFFKAVIFDGSDEEGPQDVNVFIGNERLTDTGEYTQELVDSKLLDGKSWPLRMAFFSLEEHEETMGQASFEMDLVAHDSGVVSDIHIEYPNFSVDQNLKALEKMKQPECP